VCKNRLRPNDEAGEEWELTALELTAWAAASATSATSAMTTAARRAIFARTGFIDSQGAALNFLACQGLDRGFCPFGRRHGDKTKTA